MGRGAGRDIDEVGSRAQLGANTKMEQTAEAIRSLVLRTLNDLGRATAQPTGESLLTLAGYYVGREFRFTGIRAVWMASQSEIKFYDDNGRLVRAVGVEQISTGRAA
jgi:hypothetical protein